MFGVYTSSKKDQSRVWNPATAIELTTSLRFRNVGLNGNSYRVRARMVQDESDTGTPLSRYGE